MRNPNDILINLRKHSNESTYQYLRLYRNLLNEQMFYAAYQRIYAKPGNMTSSTDGRTIDQMTLQRIDDIIKRLKYVRYADDFLIGVAGSKADCEKIKADITQFMSEKLRLELSAEKTLITNAQDKAKFLGYEIRGFYNYYSIAHNIGNEGAKFGHFMKYSFFKTLALKYRSSVSKINIKYRRGKGHSLQG